MNQPEPDQAEPLTIKEIEPAPVSDDNRLGAGEVPAIELRNVVHTFKTHRALDGVNFQVAKGELHGFVGPNGAGKTTSLKLICTLLQPQMGTVKVLGEDVTQHVRSVRQKIGFMPDHFSSYRQMTVFEYLDFFGAAYGMGLKQRNQVIEDVLELTDMAGRSDSLIQGLSRGMQQRVSLARVLVNDPELLLLDEPASGLDPRARIELMQILQALKGLGKTIFISSHILSELSELCDSVTIIDRGKVKYSGTLDELQEHNHENPSYQLQLSNGEEIPLEKLESIHGVISAELSENGKDYRVVLKQDATDSNQFLKSLIENDIMINRFQKEQRHLNQAFLDLTEQGVR